MATWGPLKDDKIRQILLDHHYVSVEEGARLGAVAERDNRNFVDVAIERDLVTADLVAQAIAEYYGVPYTNLDRSASQTKDVNFPEGVAREYRVVIVRSDEKTVTIATSNPEDAKLKFTVGEYFPKKDVVITYAPDSMIEQGFSQHHTSLQSRFAKIVEKDKKIAPEVIDQIFDDAYNVRASDIHLEPQVDDVIVRFRIDGELIVAGTLPKKYYEGIVNRVKMQANMPIDEHFKPQDGGFRITRGGHVVDVRVSVVPILEGEKVVMRFLPAYLRDVSLDQLGLSDTQRGVIEKAGKRPYGMILTVGPTGSGKTTTLYALFKIINRPGINITTIEDPVEYKVPGVNQIHVNEKQGLTFSEGLRATVRQDPDVILVGEIRDPETADIAVNAALSGHLLLSTLHANDAATAIPRLIDMGVQPFQLASVLEAVVAQRLVRRLCLSCRQSYVMTKQQYDALPKGASAFFKPKMTLYEAPGCRDCGHTGYKGRIALFEILEATPEIRALIHEKPTSDEIWKHARKQGTRTLFEDGVDKALAGITSLEEVLGVATPPDDISRAKGR